MVLLITSILSFLLIIIANRTKRHHSAFSQLKEECHVPYYGDAQCIQAYQERLKNKNI